MSLSAPLPGDALLSFAQFQTIRLAVVLLCALCQGVFWVRFARLGLRLLPCLAAAGLMGLSALALLRFPHAALFWSVCCMYALFGCAAGIVCGILWKKFNL